VIIDLSRFSGVEVDSEAKTAVLRGSILSKQVAVALAEKGFFTGIYSPESTLKNYG
jgi:FAD/FMN-containing dehydrogenase